MAYVVWPELASQKEQIGTKAYALAELGQLGIPIPAWFALTPDAFFASLSHSQRAVLEQAQTMRDVHVTFDDLALAEPVQVELAQALGRLCSGHGRVAVRSSASEEDGSSSSFAGQLDSFLSVRPGEVADKVADVWRSAFRDRVLAYRCQRGLYGIPKPPAVLIQHMLNPQQSGVAFAADPVTGRRIVAVVTAVYGLAIDLVSGECRADTYWVDRQGRLLSSQIAQKRHATICVEATTHGTQRVPVPCQNADRPVLSDQEVRKVTELVRRVSQHYDCPQDIEWAMEGPVLYLLQARPITSVIHLPNPDEDVKVWDNSNIAESYGGVTTPLTFSFARHAYEAVYREFCRLLRVPMDRVEEHETTFRCMLGLVRGRMYYNLENWYRVLALLPGFSFNQGFMEQMMGLRERLPAPLRAEIAQTARRKKMEDAWSLLIMVCALIGAYCRLPRTIERFFARVNEALTSQPVDLTTMSATELAAHYRDLQKQLLRRWDAPLINDFFAMMFFGLLRRLTARWCNDSQGHLENDLLCGEGGVISTEPVHELRGMARIAAHHAEFVPLLCDGTTVSITQAMKRIPDLERRYRQYLERFGDRCLAELKLESPTLHDDPLPLFRAMGHLACLLLTSENSFRPDLPRRRREEAERSVRKMLRRRPGHRLVYFWVLRQTRFLLRHRENLRFERTRVFGRMRRLFLELGRRFAAHALLEEPRDIFYLECDEILGFVDGTTCTANLRGLIPLRKAEYEGYRSGEVPPDHFETAGMVGQGRLSRPNHEPKDQQGDYRKGIGCCTGSVTGPVCVVTDPRLAKPDAGAIIVAERTDPGWITLFPFASGLLVEHGSLLSHTAIVAREMGLPTIVSIEGLTRWLKDGQWVEVDGGSGVVRRLDRPAAEVNHAA